MIRTQIQLSETQADLLRTLAASEGVSMAELIRRAVDTMGHDRSLSDDAERRRRAMALVGAFASGRHDISADHDRYLAEDLAR
jgi:hypothetical protein